MNFSIESHDPKQMNIYDNNPGFQIFENTYKNNADPGLDIELYYVNPAIIGPILALYSHEPCLLVL